ncbi:MAG: DNA polymerase III subunit delta [Ruminococcus sp.]|nr:DNA polymerase III subunit delta [Ruminococcus sp.]
MPYMNAKAAAAELKKSGPANLYYIYGQNVTDVEKLTKLIVRAAAGENEEFALTKLNGRELSFTELSDTIQMMPMMSDYNCILVNDYNCERPRDDMRGYTAEDLNKKLLEAIKDIPPMTVVIFNVTGFEIKTKYDKKSGSQVINDKNKKLADFAAKNGITVECPVKTPEAAAKDIAAAVSARGSAISLENARLINELCLSDPLAIKNEVDKLCAYSGSREIDRETILSMVHHQSNPNVFRLANAVAASRRAEAFEALGELMSDKDNRGTVLFNITASFIDMYRAACAKKTMRTQEDMTADFGYKWGFKVGNAFRDSSRMSIKRLRSCIVILRDTAAKLNSTSADEKIVLEQMITRMLMTAN